MISSVADLATSTRSIVQVDASPYVAPRRDPSTLTIGHIDLTGPHATVVPGRRRSTSPAPAIPLVGLTTQVCWWAALTTGLTCSIVPIVNRGALVAWVAAVATLAANTALCLAGALPAARRDRRDTWTGLIALSGAGFALTQAVRLATIVTSAAIEPSGRLEVIGLFLLSTVYAAMATAGAWIRDLNSKVVTR